MSCIVGIADGKRVVIAGDSWVGNTEFGSIRNDPKVFRNGPYAIGFCGSMRMGQVLRYMKLPTPQAPMTHKFMTTAFVDAVRRRLKSAGIAQKHNEAEYGGTFLVGYGDKLYMVDEDYQVGESATGYFTIGSGVEVAAGAIYALKNCHPWNPHDEIDHEVIARMAVEAAAHHVPTVSGPIVVVST